jgi:cell division protein FtsL
MAAPQRRSPYRATEGRGVRERPEGRSASARTPNKAAERRRRLLHGRAFVALVLVPTFLMLGSVYLHTLATGLKGEAARLEEEKNGAESEGERLDVRVTELSDPGRIRALARKSLQMQDPGGSDLATYGNDGEDVANGGGETEKEPGRQQRLEARLSQQDAR